MSMNLITLLGWRRFFMILGGVWGFVGVLIAIVVKEPVRGQYIYLPPSADEPKPQQSFFKKLFSSYWDLTLISSIRWNLLGSFFRFWGYACILAFQFTFFGFF